MCSLQLLHHSDVPRLVWGDIQPVGGSRGQGERVQMCEHPKAMRQPWPQMTQPTRGAGHKFGTVCWCPWRAVVALCACARERSCMKRDERFFFPAWYLLGLRWPQWLLHTGGGGLWRTWRFPLFSGEVQNTLATKSFLLLQCLTPQP